MFTNKSAYTRNVDAGYRIAALVVMILCRAIFRGMWGGGTGGRRHGRALGLLQDRPRAPRKPRTGGMAEWSKAAVC